LLQLLAAAAAAAAAACCNCLLLLLAAAAAAAAAAAPLLQNVPDVYSEENKPTFQIFSTVPDVVAHTKTCCCNELKFEI